MIIHASDRILPCDTRTDAVSCFNNSMFEREPCGLSATSVICCRETSCREKGGANLNSAIRLQSLIGQSSLKERLLFKIQAAKQNEWALPHLLFSGPPGVGKSTFAKAIASEMAVSCDCTRANDWKKTRSNRRSFEPSSSAGPHRGESRPNTRGISADPRRAAGRRQNFYRDRRGLGHDAPFYYTAAVHINRDLHPHYPRL